MEGVEELGETPGADEEASAGSLDDVPLAQLRKAYEPSQSVYDPDSVGYAPPARPGMTSTGVNTGGVLPRQTTAKHTRVRRSEPTLGNQVDKMRILVPLFKGLGLKENLRKLLLSQASLEAYRKGDTV